jgi:hypothetical protein
VVKTAERRSSLDAAKLSQNELPPREGPGPPEEIERAIPRGSLVLREMTSEEREQSALAATRAARNVAVRRRTGHRRTLPS